MKARPNGSVSLAFSLVLVLLATSAIHCGDSSSDPTLEDKLQGAFDRYASARERIVQRVVVEEGRVDREEWDAWLAPEPEMELTAVDLEALAGQHDDAIEAARLAAREASVIDLDAFRHDAVEVDSFCRQVPKGAMIHIHPGGTRSRTTVQEILAELDPVVDGTAILAEANDGLFTMLYADEVAFLSSLPVSLYSELGTADRDAVVDLLSLPTDPPTHPFMRFEALFSIGDALLGQDPSRDDWVREKTYNDFLLRAASLGVSYVEFTKVSFDPAGAFEGWNALGPQLEADTGVTVRWNVACGRTGEPEVTAGVAAALIDAAETQPSPYAVGIDLLANETDTPALETGQAIYVPMFQAHAEGRIGLRRTMHAGELGRIDNVRDALIMGVDRVGHGYLLQEDLVTLEHARRTELAVVANIVSNYRLQVSPEYATHPFLPYLRLGLRVSLSTDDEGMFHTDIANECLVAVMNTDVQYAELVQMARNSLETSFASDEDKAALLQRLDEDLAAFEAAWNG